MPDPQRQKNRYNLWHYVKLLMNRVITPIALTDGATDEISLQIRSNTTEWSADGSEKWQAAYLLDGRIYTIAGAAQDKASFFDCTGTETTDLSSGEYCKVLLTVDDSQADQVHQGEIVTTSKSQAPMPFPDEVIGGDEAVFGYIEVAGSHTWGTTGTADSDLYEGIDLS